MKRRDFLLAAGVAAGGTAASGTAAAQEGTTSGSGNQSGGTNAAGSNATGNTTGGGNGTGNTTGNQTGDASGDGGGGGSTKTVEVGPGGSFKFSPEEATIAPGTAVEFVWKSDGHNVVPDDGDWGHQPIEGEGFSFTTPPFEETGEHPYVCVPHEGAGMVGAIVVQEGGASSGGGEEQQNPEEMGVPFQAHFVGIATILMMVVSLIYTFFTVKYGESPNAKGGNN
jgi:plastocyanin